MKKESQELEDGPKADIHLESLRTKLEKYQIGKRCSMMIYMNAGFKKSKFVHNRLALKLRECLEEANISEWMTKEKTFLIQKTSKRKYPQQLITRPLVMWKILTA